MRVLQLLTFISEPSNLNFSHSVMQKCALGRETLKIKVVEGLELCNFLLDTARIIYANTL